MSERREWPFKNMSIGDQVEIEERDGVTTGVAARAAYGYGTGTGKRFKCRTLTRGDSKYLTVERLA